MDKYTAFNLYRSGWTTQGVAVPLEPDGERHDVYLASDVEALQQRLYDCESALLLRHDRALATYVGKYPHPIKKPSP
jgi:hypothetical protein